jgi:Domain of unknown function (DUF4331)
MSSHREAPSISKDPVADNTDTYAFVSPDKPSTVTLIMNYLPGESPAGGPNFYEFGDDVLYEFVIDNDMDADSDIKYQFRFKTEIKNPNTFLYNFGQITSLTSAVWNRVQTYSVARVTHGHTEILGSDLLCPPVNIGPRSTPNYAALASAAVHTLSDGSKVFAGQRRDGFFVDLGSIFDLGDLRPFENLHLIPTPATAGHESLKNLNVHTIALQVPKTKLTKGGYNPTDPADSRSVIGMYARASRRKARILHGPKDVESGPWVQVSRLGNPLINEVITPMAQKDYWNSERPKDDSQFIKQVLHPELAGLLNVLYPGVFPKIAAYSKDRADLQAILMTGIPSGIITGFQNYTGPVIADLLRLNLAIPPTTSKPSPMGILGGDLAGYPNGRRVADDVVTIEVRAIAGVTIPLVDPSFTPDGAASLVTDGVTPGDRYISHFPYLGTPKSGFDTP